MTDQSPLDDLEFLARSQHRVRVLESLQSAALTRAELHDETKISQPTLGRVLGGLQTRNWVTQHGKEFSLTPLGRLLAEEFSDLLETVETIQELSDLVSVFPLEQLDFDIRLLSDATITKSKPNDVLIHIRRAEILLSEADCIRVLTPSIFPDALEKLMEGQSPHQHEAILTGGALEAMRANPSLLNATRVLIANGVLDLYHYDGSVSLMLAMVDHKGIIAPLDEDDLPRALIESENQTICSWVDAQLDEFRDVSTVVTVDDLAT